MDKNKKNDNLLIKKNLILILNKHGVTRVSPDSIQLLEKYFNEFLLNLASVLREEMITHGRKTLKKEDVKNALKKLSAEEEVWEV